ncbi:hypothetical protein CYANOKiyG1_49220 [Okeania sp. KiyG1]|nr:hypothetical protein CYANOKiyG1_49220 [Okeania sp. KiyG1]
MLGGGAFLFVDPNLPLDRVQVMLQQATVKYVILLSGSPMPDLADLSLPYLYVDAKSGEIDSSHLTELAWTRSLPEVQADDPAYVFFTSGTTGTPKGILGLQKSLAHFINWQREEFSIDKSDRCAQLTAISFDVVLRDIFLPLTSGAALCIPKQLQMSPVQILDWLQDEQITVIHIVPTLAQFWLDYAPANFELNSLRWVFFSGEPLTDKLLRQWHETLTTEAKIINLYGPTETCLVKCYHQVSEDIYAGIQPIGKPLPDAQALVLSSNGRLCGISEIGEIVIRTPFRTSGYLPLSTDKKCFVPNHFTKYPDDLIYYTGDIGRYHPLGILEILGRSDDQVKINGIRIEPAEVTAVLSRHSDVRNCVVIPISSTEHLPYLVAYIVTSTEKEESEFQGELKAFLTQKLPAAFVPSVFIFLPELPRKSNGKVDRHALPIPNRQTQVAVDEALAPRNLAERRLALIWKSILNRSSINLQDNFFDLGELRCKLCI